MFRFVYAWHVGEPLDLLAASEFAGVECDAKPPAGVDWVGRRLKDDVDDQSLLDPSTRPRDYLVVVPQLQDRPTSRLLDRLRAIRGPAVLGPRLMVENGDVYGRTLELWNMLEAIHQINACVSLDIDAAAGAGQTPQVLIPTLNLRIGSIRVSMTAERTVDYARRLAGIGFEGDVICDPPAVPNRPAAALEIAAQCRGVFPPKSAKKAAKASAKA